MQRTIACTLTVFTLTVCLPGKDWAPVEKAVAFRDSQGVPCHVVISNESFGDPPGSRRLLVMMDKGNFTEANFLELYQHFSRIYPAGENLFVRIQSSLPPKGYRTEDDLEASRAARAGIPREYKPKFWEQDAQGFIHRSRATERFGHKPEGGDLRDMRSVTLKNGSCQDCDTSLPQGASNQTRQRRAGRKAKDWMPCYFVLENELINDRRFIRLFINADEGTESNLVKLLGHFGQLYPGNQSLYIKIHSHLRQEYALVIRINTDQPELFGEYYTSAMDKFFVAALFRSNGHEVVRYREAGGLPITLIVDGHDIFPDLDDDWSIGGHDIRW